MIYGYLYNYDFVATHKLGKSFEKKVLIVKGIYVKDSKVSENDPVYLVLKDDGKLILEKVGRARAALLMFRKDLPKHLMKIVKRVLKNSTDEKGYSEVMFFENRKQLKKLIKLQDKLEDKIVEDEYFEGLEEDDDNFLKNHLQYLVAEFE